MYKISKVNCLIVSTVVFLYLIFNFSFCYALRAQAERLCDEGKKLFKMGKYSEAEIKFSAAIAEDASYSESYYYMAQIYALRNNFDEALNYAKKALSNTPHEETYKVLICDINNNMALDAIKNNNLDRAYKLYFSNLELVPYHLPTYNRIAALSIKKGDYTDALLQCNKAIEKSSSTPQNISFDQSEKAMLYANMAICFFEMKNYNRAMQEIEKAKKINDSQYIQKIYARIISDENPIIAELKKADNAFEKGDLKLAREGYEKVLALSPNHPGATEKLSIIINQLKVENTIYEAELLTNQKLYEDAIEKYKLALTLDPTRVYLNERINDLNEKLKHEQNKAVESIKKKPQSQKTSNTNSTSSNIDEKLKQLIEKATLETNPDVVYEKYFNDAEKLYNTQQYDKALELYQKIKDEKPDFKNEEINKRIRTIHALKGEYYIEYYNLALPKIYIYIGIIVIICIIIWIYFGNQIILLLKPSPVKFFKKGIDYLDNEQYHLAITNFEKALSMVVEPIERAKIKAKLAYCYFKIKDYDKCIKISLEVLDVDPKNEFVHNYLANSFLEKGVTTERAISEYKLLFKKQKDDKRLLTILCNHFIKEDNLSQDAIEVYQKVFTLDPNNADVKRMLCEAFMRSNEKSDFAIKVYEAVLADDPKKHDVKLMLISAKFSQKKFEECIMLCEELFEIGIIENVILEYYTNSYLKVSNKAELYQKYKELYQKYPNNQVLKSYLEKLQSQLAVEKLMTGDNTENINFKDISNQNQTPTSAKPAVNICHNCARMNSIGATKCEYCGAELKT